MVYLGIETVFSSGATDGKESTWIVKVLTFSSFNALPVKITEKIIMVGACRWNLFDVFSKTLQEHFVYAREKALSIIHSAQNWPKKAISVRGIASSLRASSPWHSGGAAGEGRRACNCVSEIWIPLPIPLWLPVDWAVRFQPISAKGKRTQI